MKLVAVQTYPFPAMKPPERIGGNRFGDDSK